MSNYQNTFKTTIRQARYTIMDLPGFLKFIRATGKRFDTKIICFNRASMAGKKHALSAVAHALRSFESGDPISRSIEIEALLYAGGTRQTGLIGPFGIHEGENELFICSIPDSPQALEICIDLMMPADNEEWDELTPEKRTKLAKLFAIPLDELSVVPEEKFGDLVLERVALLDVYR
jgi:KEOPS complex subunit Cgi121